MARYVPRPLAVKYSPKTKKNVKKSWNLMLFLFHWSPPLIYSKDLILNLFFFDFIRLKRKLLFLIDFWPIIDKRLSNGNGFRPALPLFNLGSSFWYFLLLPTFCSLGISNPSPREEVIALKLLSIFPSTAFLVASHPLIFWGLSEVLWILAFE